jgi:hypothetical protein
VVGVDNHVFSISARSVWEACHGHDTIANGECRHVTTHLIDNPSDVVAEDAWRSQTRPRAVSTISGIDRVDTRGMDNDANLLSPRNGFGHFSQPQLLGTTKRADDYRWGCCVD